MKHILVFVVFAWASITALSAPPHPPSEDRYPDTPVGQLGYPIGASLKIEGVREETAKGKAKGEVRESRVLLVDTVDGYKLDKPVRIWIENCDLPGGERCVLEGYETGKWVGSPTTGSQIPFQFCFYFIVTSPIQPQSLKLR